MADALKQILKTPYYYYDAYNISYFICVTIMHTLLFVTIYHNSLQLVNYYDVLFSLLTSALWLMHN